MNFNLSSVLRRRLRCGAVAGAVLFVTASVHACGGSTANVETVSDSVRLEIADQVMRELGGELTARLSPPVRWRLISSVGVGLPPPGFHREQLPEAESRPAALLQVYCTQCHGLPTPLMHSAAEWPTLLRRMEARSRTLRYRMKGPHLEGALGERVLFGLTSSFVPSPADRDTLLQYLQAHALPVAEREEIPDDEAGKLYLEKCAICHEVPDPAAHTAEEWAQEVVPRMQGNMGASGLPTLTEAERETILDFLQRNAGG